MRLPLVLALAGLTGCSLDWSRTQSDETPISSSDAGTDASQVTLDAALPLDAQAPDMDAGAPAQDASAPEEDAGRPACDPGFSRTVEGLCAPFEWGEPETLVTYDAGTAGVPQLVMDEHGAVTVGWAHADTGVSLRARTRDGAWSEVQTIALLNGKNSALALVQLSNGDLMAMWTSSLYEPVTARLQAWYSNTGIAGGMPVFFNEPGVRVGLAAHGETVQAVWTREDRSESAQARTYRSGSGWGNRAALPGLPHGGAPSVTFDGAGRAHVASTAVTTGTGPASTYAVAQYETGQGTWSESPRWLQTGQVKAQPLARTVSNGDVLIAWSELEGALTRVHCVRFDAAAASYGTRAAIANGELLDLTSDASGTAFAVARDGATVRLIRYRDGVWDAPVELAVPVTDAHVAMDGLGNAVAVFTENTAVKATRFRAGEGRWSEVELVASEGTASARDVKVVLDGEARATAVWREGNGSTAGGLYSARLGPRAETVVESAAAEPR